MSQDLYVFKTFSPQIGITFNQYLLTGKEPLLVHTGSFEQAKKLLLEINKILCGQSIAYVFVSHFESDECGGLQVIREAFPKVQTICSAVTARQLSGFGIKLDALVQAPDSTLQSDSWDLRFIAYPSEAHLWEGLLAFEQQQGILFSSDLFIRRGNDEQSVTSTLAAEVATISDRQVPHPAGMESLKQSLAALPVKLIAPGHGPCVKL